MLKYDYHCVLKLKGVYGARQIRSHPKSGTRRSSESAVLSLGWFVFSRKGASSVLLQLKGRRWPRCLIIQNLISVHPSVVSVSLPQLCLVSWRPCPCGSMSSGVNVLHRLGREVRESVVVGIKFWHLCQFLYPALLRACISHVLRVREKELACFLCSIPLQLLAFRLLWTVS